MPIGSIVVVHPRQKSRVAIFCLAKGLFSPVHETTPVRSADLLRRGRPMVTTGVPAAPTPDAQDVGPSTEQLHAGIQARIIPDLLCPPAGG